MPSLGEIRNGKDIGYLNQARYVWDACQTCGKERWVPVARRAKISLSVCNKCAQRSLYPITYHGKSKPLIGDTTTTAIAGFKGRGVCVWVACPSCGVERWKQQRFKDNYCPSCGIPKGATKRTGNNNGRYKDGKRRAGSYIFVKVDEQNKYFAMGKKVSKTRNVYQVAEHRLVMAQHIGRLLLDDEIVHHVNGVKSDNRIENLRLLKTSQHHAALVLKELQDKYCTLERDVKALNKRILELETDNIRLQTQIEAMLIPSEAARDISCGTCRDLTGDTLEATKGEGKVHSSRKLGGASA